MKLISCHIDAYGKLKNVDVDFNKGITTICEKNGYGKTTLASFIKAMFYGLENSRKKLGERAKYQPFDGGNFGGELTFLCQKGVFKIRRNFLGTATKDEFFLYNAENNLKSDEFSSNIGRELFGVGRETFDATVFFGQKELVSEINDDIKASLSTGKLYGDDVDALSKALLKIKEKIKDYQKENKALDVDGQKGKLRELNLKESALGDKIKNANEIVLKNEKELSSLERVKEEMDSKQKEFEKLSSERQAVEIYLADISNVNVKVEETKKEEETKKGGRVLFSLSIILIALSLVFVGVFVASKSMIFIYSFIGSLLLGVALLTVAIFQKKRKNGAKNEKNVKKSEFFDKNQPNLEKIKEKENAILNIEKKINSLFGGSVEEFVSNYEDVVSRMNTLQKEIVEKRNDVKHYQNEIENLGIMECNDYLQASIEKSEDLAKKIALLELTQNFLTSASQNLSKRYVGPVQQKFDEYYKKFLQDDAVVIDGNLDVRLKRNMFEEGYLSAGVFDLVEICKRFALVDLVYAKERPFIVLDDPFVNLDDSNLEVAKNLIAKLAERFQIVLLTCHKSRKI